MAAQVTRKTNSYVAILLLVCTITLGLSSCDKARLFEENQQINNNSWDYKDAKTFVTEISDTSQNYNLYVNVRHSFQFEWRNAWVNIKTIFPDGKTFDKRVNLVLSEPDGHWYGDCLGDNCDLQVSIQNNAFFPQNGKYTFIITQDMRVNPLPFVKSVGMRIEKAGAEGK